MQLRPTPTIHSIFTSITTYVHIYVEYRRPTLRDVYKHVVPEYAHKWKCLGALLHFKQAELDIIFNNFRNDAEECCRSLLSRWLEKSPDASWDQLLSAIDDIPQPPPLPPSPPEILHQGMIIRNMNKSR